ncbi:hypothetical protein AN219_19805 [Streptomyces nanshensis]|nr:hypothetical protein AN219_19805 [Streptomyces nanshensis]
MKTSIPARLARLCALILGTGFVVVGVMRFVPLSGLPGWETAEPLHGTLHLASGLLWLAAGLWAPRGWGAARADLSLGLFWLLLGVFGNLSLLDWAEPLSFDDNKVHLAVGILATAAGCAARIDDRRAGRRPVGADGGSGSREDRE